MNATPTKTTRDELIEEANRKRAMADKAHKAGDADLRDSYLAQAADRYRDAGQSGMASWCEKFIGK